MYDVVVVGAGPAGAGAAYQMARRGLATCLVEARHLTEAGPSWANTVARWMLDRAGIAPPVEPEWRPVRRRVIAADPSLVVDPEPVMHVEMRRLVSRLQGLARDAGAEVIDRIEIEELEHRGGRPTGLVVRRRDEAAGGVKLSGRLFVDATGLAGALRRRAPELSDDCPPVTREHLCSAAHYTHGVADPDGAEAFFAKHGADPGDRINFLGVVAGYSTLSVTLTEARDELGVLTGAAVSSDAPTGEEMNRAFADEHPWVGERLHGGSAAIPIRRPYDRLAAPGIALVGNAACQVFPAHGSGVGPALVAGCILAEQVSGFDDPGSEAATWAYQSAFQRELGAVLGAYDAFRRMSQGFEGNEPARIFGLGLSTEANTVAGITQRMPAPSLRDLLRSVAILPKAPGIARKVVPTALRMKRIHRHYLKYPTAPDRQRLVRWSRRAARFFGDEPDVTG